LIDRSPQTLYNDWAGFSSSEKAGQVASDVRMNALVLIRSISSLIFRRAYQQIALTTQLKFLNSRKKT
jgi:hypothetical protein